MAAAARTSWRGLTAELGLNCRHVRGCNTRLSTDAHLRLCRCPARPAGIRLVLGNARRSSLGCRLAADIDAWTQLLSLNDQPDLVTAEPGTLRYRLWHLPAKLTHHARRRWLTISTTWPWRDAFILCWQRLNSLPAQT